MNDPAPQTDRGLQTRSLDGVPAVYTHSRGGAGRNADGLVAKHSRPSMSSPVGRVFSNASQSLWHRPSYKYWPSAQAKQNELSSVSKQSVQELLHRARSLHPVEHSYRQVVNGEQASNSASSGFQNPALHAMVGGSDELVVDNQVLVVVGSAVVVTVVTVAISSKKSCGNSVNTVEGYSRPPYTVPCNA